MSVENVLNTFAKRVIQQSRSNLTKKDKNASKALYDSLGYELNVSKNSFSLSINMDDHGKFVDKGVTGKNDANFKGIAKKINTSLAGYKFGSGNFRGKGQDWHKKIDKWMYSRGISPRDKETGKFIKRDTANYLIRRSIYQHGLKPTNFFSKPLENEFKKLPDDLINAYALTVDNLLV